MGGGVESEEMGWELKKGSEVEICTDEEGFRGAWFEGTIISKKESSVLVEYKTLISNDSSETRLQEWVDTLQLRPLQPPDQTTTNNNKNKRIYRKFEMSEEVDAWYNDGWWEGVVTQVLADSRYAVFFRETREQIVFPASELRVHREWIRSTWLPAPIQHHQKLGCSEVPTGIEVNGYKEEGRVVFGEEMLVEVSSDEEGFQGAWFAATIIKRTKGDKYLIEYKSLRNDDDTDFLREESDASHIRPYPPDTIMVDRFNLHEEVDALYNDGWWVGVVSKVLNDGRYVVYFRSTDEEMKFNHSELRIHQEWVNDTWVLSSGALKL